MWFEPGFGLLTALLFDSVEFLAERTRGGTIDDYYRESVATSNRMLNNDIRRVKEKYGLKLAEMALKQIQMHVEIFHKNFTVQQAHGKIIIDQDNFDYIIALLEKCANDDRTYAAKIYSEGYTEGAEKYRKKAEMYQQLVDDVKIKKERRLKELAEEKVRKEQEKASGMNVLLVFLALVFIIVVLVLAI